jgi:hypothetical protein
MEDLIKLLEQSNSFNVKNINGKVVVYFSPKEVKMEFVSLDEDKDIWLLLKCCLVLRPKNKLVIILSNILVIDALLFVKTVETI